MTNSPFATLKPIETISGTLIAHLAIGLIASIFVTPLLAILVSWWMLIGFLPIWGTVTWMLYQSFTEKDQVVEFHTSLVTFLGKPVRAFVLGAGLHWLPLPPLLGISKQPVPTTRFIHLDTSHKKEVVDLGHFTDAEKKGQVFMGERLFKAIVSVQARDRMEVLIDANYVIKVIDPMLWKASDNPWGTLMNRFEASLRIVISKFNGMDVNDLQSVIPHVMQGGVVILARCPKKKGNLDIGDVIRNKNTREPIFRKINPSPHFTNQPDGLSVRQRASVHADILKELNDFGDEDGKQEQGFTENHIVMIRLNPATEGLTLEEIRLGAESVTMAIQDITLPEIVATAAAKAKAAMKERVASITAAETTKLATEKLPNISTEEGRVRAEMVMAERGNATYIIGRGDNIVAQLGGILRG